MIKFIAYIALFIHHLAFSEGLSGSNVSTVMLNNGLKIIIKTDRRAPVFISQLWYKVGASDEFQPITGISHMLEHMMFKGSRDYKSGEFSRIIARNGGDENAFTSKDYTVYYQKMHQSKLELAIKMEADRMRHLSFSDTELTKERQVVIEERRLRVEDNPNAKVYENLRLISFDSKGAYHAPIIGFQADIENYHLSDLRHWYETYYAPNNATLVVVGDVDPERVIEYATRYFGGYKANPNIDDNKNRPSIALNKQSRMLKLKAELPFYTISFHVPSLATINSENKAYQLEMLAHILDNGLSKALMRNQQIVSGISVGYRLYDKFDTLFTISFVPVQGISSQNILQMIKIQVRELIEKPHLIEAELRRTKVQLEADFIFEQDQISTQSYYLGMLSSVGLKTDKLLNYVAKMNQVSTRDVANVAEQYLDFDMLNYVELIPQGTK
ncbi:insulinase family protein [Candidatus Ruthia endofausta]|uniref:Insulinase family protein n=1 Tax=Candidatus Ruthia endofausta TaxID=2738852 RepID=A0A6N0HMV0_9GAMM|nr:pitrilysin family protein [Candidatus Ruthia endofausta]QKQ23666.1 insulinase family protein [Candidatus Ruthia endofausta]